jgi:O-antigen/teichoic acid export membrane protein
MVTPEGLASRTLRGSMWAYGSLTGGQLVIFVSTAILARLLGPDDFGLVAAALVFITLLDTVSDLGLSPALVISKPEELNERANTVFVATVCIGAGLSALIAAGSPLAGEIFDEPDLPPLLAVLGLNFLLRSLGATHYALAQKQIDFRSRTTAELAAVITRGVVGIGLALAGVGAWSLVLAYLAGTAAMTAMLWALIPWRPRMRLSRRQLPRMLRFGGTLTAVDILAAVIGQIDYFFVGRVLGTHALGLYTLAFRLPGLVIISGATVAGRVLFPAFAAVEGAALGGAFLKSLRYCALVAMPAAAALCVLAEPTVLAILGQQWPGAIEPMRVVTLFALAVALGIPAGTAYKARGNASILLKLAIPRALLAAALIAIFVSEGIVAVAACQAAVATLFAALGLGIAVRMLSVRPRAIALALWPGIVVASATAAALLPVLLLIQDPPALTLLVAVPVGAAVYALALRRVAPDVIREVRATLPRGRVAAPAVNVSE